jgi:hypothetical protein
MNYRRNSLIVRLSLILVLVVILAGATACWEFDLITENQTDQILTICYGRPCLGDLGPGESMTTEAYFDEDSYLLFALNTQGELVFAQDFTFETLQEVENDVWKAVIPPDIPHRGTTVINLIVGNDTDMVLTVTVDNEELGDINPGETATKRDIPLDMNQLGDSRYSIIAQDAQGQEIFVDTLFLSELQVIDFRNYKLVIEPFYHEFVFKNETDMVLTVYVNNEELGNVGPGETLRKKVPLYSPLVVKEAKNAQGELVYSSSLHYYSYKIEGQVWTVVIPAPD